MKMRKKAKLALVCGSLFSFVNAFAASDVKSRAAEFLRNYQNDYAKLYGAAQLANWRASNTGKTQDFEAKSNADLELKKFHSNSKHYEELKSLLKRGAELDPMIVRELAVAELDFKANQLPADILKKLTDMESKIEQAFNTFRAEFEGKRLSNNDLLVLLKEEKNSDRRKAIWESLKRVGAAVAPDLIELAKLRNEAAKRLGFKNYWDMAIRLQEHDPKQIVELFDDLEKRTNRPYASAKLAIDRELATHFGLKPSEIEAWHYDNPFFQAAPPSDKVNLDEFYKNKKKEDIVEMAEKFYNDIGIPITDIVARSDLYEREGKDQHAFSNDMDRNGDVRTLQNVRPSADSMDTMLHEMGHSVYSKTIDRKLPFNLRAEAHIFSTEGIAMMMGALASNPLWLIKYAGADPGRVEEVKKYVVEQRKREQLIFARWTLVMLNFEKSFYENPNQDLNRLWWDLVSRFQKVPHPKDRAAPDWAAKPHFVIAPVYYHNYMMGELFAAQLRAVLSKTTNGSNGKPYFLMKDLGAFLREKVFAPGMTLPWPPFIEKATGEPLTAKYFAAEVQ